MQILTNYKLSKSGETVSLHDPTLNSTRTSAAEIRIRVSSRPISY